MRALRPITSRLSARLRGFEPFDDAVEVIEIDGPTEWELEPVIALPGELDRFAAHHPHSTPEKNLALLTSSTLVQGACRMHRFRDAIIADGTVLTRRSYQAIQERGRRWLLTGQPETLDEATLCSTWATERFFGHWLHDGLAHELLATSRGSTAVTLSGVTRQHELGYRKLVDLPANPISFAEVENLWLLEDWDFGRNRAQRVQELVRRIRSHFSDDGPRYVFVGRGNLGVAGRALSNEAQIVEALQRRGFLAILRPEELTSEQIARSLRNARVVVGVEGSALGHSLMSAPSSAGFLTMMGPRHFNMHYRPYAAGRGIRLAYTIGDSVDAETFMQPVDRLLKTIDLLDSALG